MILADTIHFLLFRYLTLRNIWAWMVNHTRTNKEECQYFLYLTVWSTFQLVQSIEIQYPSIHCFVLPSEWKKLNMSTLGCITKAQHGPIMYNISSLCHSGAISGLNPTPNYKSIPMPKASYYGNVSMSKTYQQSESVTRWWLSFLAWSPHSEI